MDDRRVLNGIFWVLRSGAPWPTCRRVVVRAPPAPTLCPVPQSRRLGPADAISAAYDGDIQMIDSTSIRAAATTKRAIEIIVSVRLGLTAGQTHDGRF